MNRLLSILVTLFILFLVYLWINHLMGNAQKPPESAERLEDPMTEQPAEDYNTQKEEDTAPQDLITTSDPEPEPVQPVPAKEISKPNSVTTPPQEPAKEQNPPAEKPANKPVSVKITDQEGAHLVIAGNFLERANAEERVKELRKLGYNKAEVVNFELSEYHTACAGRYTDLNEARRVAKKIKDQHSIDTYVRHGN